MRPFFFAHSTSLYDAPVQTWRLANSREIDLSNPALMAILNCTPDSFFDGSRIESVDAAVEAAISSHHSGARVIDVGGESTRPGAQPVDAAEQIRRIIPVIRAMRKSTQLDTIAISVDTTLAEVAHAALAEGADAVNDVSGLQDDQDAMRDLLARTHAGYILMHRRVAPASDRYSDQYEHPPAYSDVVATVKIFFRDQLQSLTTRGIDPSRIVLDPGLGFGKSVEQNMDLIRRTSEFAELGAPVLSALSRKSFVGRLAFGRDSDPAERLEGTIALTVLHLVYGARLFRVHDVAACASALRAASAFLPVHPTPPERHRKE